MVYGSPMFDSSFIGYYIQSSESLLACIQATRILAHVLQSLFKNNRQYFQFLSILIRYCLQNTECKYEVLCIYIHTYWK